jgi:uncharacterized membrane protein YheB (UPF0754 family)
MRGFGKRQIITLIFIFIITLTFNDTANAKIIKKTSRERTADILDIIADSEQSIADYNGEMSEFFHDYDGEGDELVSEHDELVKAHKALNKKLKKSIKKLNNITKKGVTKKQNKAIVQCEKTINHYLKNREYFLCQPLKAQLSDEFQIKTTQELINFTQLSIDVDRFYLESLVQYDSAPKKNKKYEKRD